MDRLLSLLFALACLCWLAVTSHAQTNYYVPWRLGDTGPRTNQKISGTERVWALDGSGTLVAMDKAAAAALLDLEPGTDTQPWSAALDALASGDGSALSALNASNVTSGTLGPSFGGAISPGGVAHVQLSNPAGDAWNSVPITGSNGINVTWQHAGGVQQQLVIEGPPQVGWQEPLQWKVNGNNAGSPGTYSRVDFMGPFYFGSSGSELDVRFQSTAQKGYFLGSSGATNNPSFQGFDVAIFHLVPPELLPASGQPWVDWILKVTTDGFGSYLVHKHSGDREHLVHDDQTSHASFRVGVILNGTGDLQPVLDGRKMLEQGQTEYPVGSYINTSTSYTANVSGFRVYIQDTALIAGRFSQGLECVVLWIDANGNPRTDPFTGDELWQPVQPEWNTELNVTFSGSLSDI